MTVNDVVYMSQSGVGESTIIKQIQNSRSVFQLNSGDVVNLKGQGVSENVINTMLDTNRRAVRPVIYERPVVVCDPCPPPVGLSFGYHYHRIR